MEKLNGEQNGRTVGCDRVLEKKKLGGGQEKQILPDRLESTKRNRGGNPGQNMERKFG